MKKIFFLAALIVMFVGYNAFSQGGGGIGTMGGSTLIVEEPDLSPSVPGVWKILVTNTSLTNNNDGTVTIATGGDLTGSVTHTIGDGSSGDVILTFDGDAGTDCTFTADVSEDAFVLDCILKLLTGASPTVDTAGDMAFDTDIWASGRGSALLYDGTAATVLLNVLVSDTPSDGQVPKFNTGGTITWENDDDSASVTIGDTQVAYATSANVLGGEAAFSYNDTTDTLSAGILQSGSSATPAVDFDDSDDAGTIEGSINVNCPTTNDCDMIFAVNSGADTETTIIQIDTTGGGVTTTNITGSLFVDTDRVVGTKEICVTIETPVDGDDNVPFFFPRSAITITDVYCQVDGGTSVAMIISDGSNALESITCDGDGAEDDGSIANGTFTSLERMEFDLDATSGSNTFLNICVTYTID